MPGKKPYACDDNAKPGQLDLLKQSLLFIVH